ncbi:histidinol dehydrogenase [Candidatus Uhrbacteria bacterium RIFCSPHIGHO2_12_FULL_54_23]|uniref:Histidinol dehydrogenase n=3 Tax=Candidatus Uhriibacteriota TaxID=1752732 RepID=A0A1F7UIS9_9BACT|nr:MAG: histidinol dehydrogenase [Candidatus Uhrbacteria bacterium RIFCSPHIGHO2_12_FULL_54_23]OGL83580.1 MAG: histidinol dehydrogenase [Candidatus Uhrbacteria bacterium RIFCSPLOWO2_01_FULL_55_36]OGL89933.1 MAG: histidinol dehydrogenase [Candidatus Uhrbacteria bacterium RIFCSPLOWO2_02_FULL_54_37]
MIPLYQWNKTSPADKARILRRAQADMEPIQGYVADIIKDVRENGDEAVVKYARKFDDADFTLERIRVTKEDVARAYTAVDPKVIAIMKEQIRISRAYAEAEKEYLAMDWNIETVPGVVTGMRLNAIESVGLYVPAGKAPLSVVAQILTVPAKVAGVPRIVVCFPPTGALPAIIVSADLAGADEIYRMGGVQAIAALTYGTETVKPVNLIAGPGNPYVQAAKLQVFGKVGIDMLSGPSEALIMADTSANPKYLAADILARCEHGGDSAGVVVTDSREVAEATLKEVERQAPLLKRQEYIQKALDQYSAIIMVNSLDEMIDLVNEYSAEHLEVQVKNARALLPRLRNAGSIFLGDHAPVAVGDYASGTNHCLPTGVAPKFASPIGVRMFMKASGYQELKKEGLATLKPIVETLSDVEGLDAHKRSVQIRFD